MEHLSEINKSWMVFVWGFGGSMGYWENVNCMGIFEDLIYTFMIFQKHT